MKIASNRFKILSLSSSALALLLTMGVSSVHAADSAPMAAPPAINLADASPSPMPAAMPLPASPSSGGLANHARNLGPLEDKVTDSIKNTVKQLGSIDNVNLDDLNSARQTVVKLEVLIEIEKHLAELDKIRNDKGGEKSLAAAIPASALSPPPMFASMTRGSAAVNGFGSAPISSGNTQGVSRISGADGHYTAVVQGKTVRVGDTAPDGSLVVAINAKEVSTKKDGAVHHMKVKGVDEVFGHTL